MSNQQDEYRQIVLTINPAALTWARASDDVHGIAYALNAPIVDEEKNPDDPDDDRRTLMIKVKRADLGNAIGDTNDWIGDLPHSDPGAMLAHEFVTALSREGLSERYDTNE